MFCSKKLHEHFEETAKRFNKKLGMMVMVPSSVPGSPRYYQEHYQYAMTMTNNMPGPHLFVTITGINCLSSQFCSGNPNWPEIQERLRPGQNWVDQVGQAYLRIHNFSPKSSPKSSTRSWRKQWT